MIERKRNDSRSKFAYLQVNYSLIDYFRGTGDQGSTAILKSVYLCELLSIQRMLRMVDKLVEGEWFYCERRRIYVKFGFSEQTLSKYDQEFEKLGLLEKKRLPQYRDSRNYYWLNHPNIDKIQTEGVRLEYGK